jgi:serine/threonine protein kinase
MERFLGEGAFGEVWVAIERNTSRRVAIKFYAHRGGLDWSLLSREVEKLAFLFADRYVVQLLAVGWEAEPPYYIMEFLEQGSLAEKLQHGPLPVAEAVELFRDLAVGLLHAHGKGVLHCDLKPANILLDQDGKPRLADFGQSRLSTEQMPALGTLFYMAPEQADVKAVPDARWDVYALGALLYVMLTGVPPYRTDEAAQALERAPDLEQRLSSYRRFLRRSPPPSAHRELPDVDRALADIVDRCLAVDPARRFANVQAVLDALAARASERARRPTMVVGTIGPALVLLIVAIFAWQGFSTAVRRSEEALVQRALDDNRITARYVASFASKELQRRFDAVESVANSEQLRAAIHTTLESPQTQQLLRELAAFPQSDRNDAKWKALVDRFRDDPGRAKFQEEFSRLIPAWMRPTQTEGEEERDEVASWFFCDARGIATVRLPKPTTVGMNFAWRSFFHGGDRDHEPTWRPSGDDDVVRQTQTSAVFQSFASGAWIVAVTTPVRDPSQGGKFLGVVALTVRVNKFVQLEKGSENLFAVLVDRRTGDDRGLAIRQHPLFDTLALAQPVAEYRKTLEGFQEIRLTSNELPNVEMRTRDYHDPLASHPLGADYDRRWLAAMEPVRIRGQETGWSVIVQESYDSAIGSTLTRLRSSLIAYGFAAMAMVMLVLVGLWGLAYRLLHEPSPSRRRPAGPAVDRPPTPLTPHDPTETYRETRQT